MTMMMISLLSDDDDDDDLIRIAHLPIREVYIEGEEALLLRVIHMPLLPGHMAPTLSL